MREAVRRQNAELAEAANDANRFEQVFTDLARREREAEAAKQAEMAALEADPFNIEAQQKIEEMIRQAQVMENLQHALDFNPEGQISPLRITDAHD